MGFIWTIIIGFVAGVIAKFLMPGPNEPQGFIMTTILGIIGAFVATFLGQAIGWYRADEGAGSKGQSSAPSSCSRLTATCKITEARRFSDSRAASAALLSPCRRGLKHVDPCRPRSTAAHDRTPMM